MKRFKEYINEGLTDQMTPKSDEEILSAYMKLSPHGLQYKLGDMDIEIDDELLKKLDKKAQEGIEEAENELNEILDIYDGGNKEVKTKELLQRLSKWIDKYGGNGEKILSNGITEIANMFEDSFDGQSHYEWQPSYSNDAIHKFHLFLKQLALDYVSYQNKDYPTY